MTENRRPVVVLVGQMYHRDGERLLAQHTEVDVLPNPTPGEIQEAMRVASGAIVRYPYRVGKEAIEGAPNLLVLSTSGRGADAIDVAAASAHGVAVVNNPGLGTVPVSEHTIALMLDLARSTHPLSAITHQGVGWERRGGYTSQELKGKTLAIIGLGNIGTEVARKCVVAFGMRVLAYDPYVEASKAEAVGASLVDDLDAMLSEADYVSVHAELNDETRGMIGEPQLARMRRTAFLINTARGPIVQEAALARALREGWIAGAALDVFEVEPLPSDSPLCGLDNLILTPHVAGLTVEAARDLASSAASQVLQVLRGKRPPHLVNPHVWDRVRQRLDGGAISLAH